ncbi:MAG TPA: PIN domain-containing protein [Actinobacteria bacterium]|nr:ribonuclease VapC33 [bacterium BMS3Bbin01]HDH25887.1 PIN domain-containing protein [Actinomycetota bacterium]
MSLTVDTNLLVYASDTESPLHGRARGLLADLAKGPDLVYVFWPVVMGYLRITTHPAVFVNPLEPAAARDNIADLIDRPHVRMPGEGRRFWDLYRDVTDRIPVRGNLVFDAHLVALMREHGVRTIWTRDRDFRKFDGIEAVDPFE